MPSEVGEPDKREVRIVGRGDVPPTSILGVKEGDLSNEPHVLSLAEPRIHGIGISILIPIFCSVTLPHSRWVLSWLKPLFWLLMLLKTLLMMVSGWSLVSSHLYCTVKSGN